MRPILALDFDGVMHPRDSGSFCRAPGFEALLNCFPSVGIIISSNWREQYSLESLRANFSAGFQQRILGVTPVMGIGVSRCVRSMEIEAACRQLHTTRFLAVDDDPSLFWPDCSYLFQTEKHYGLDAEALRRLGGRLASL